jgi:hypothetical protein
MSTKGKTVLAVLVCAVAGLIAGTIARRATPPTIEMADGYRPADSATASVIGERTTTYWQARTRQDLYGAYPFYEVGFRSTYQPEIFVKTFQRLNRFGPVFDGIDRIEVDAGGTRAKVFVKLRATSPVDQAALTTTVEDVWILVDGAWWRQAEAMTPTI